MSHRLKKQNIFLLNNKLLLYSQYKYILVINSEGIKTVIMSQNNTFRYACMKVY